LERWPATNFSQFNNWNLSYAIGLKANPLLPGAILAADRNFPGMFMIPNLTIGMIPALPEHWGTALHQREGNVLFSDAHVEESFDVTLPSEETVAEYLVYPDVKATNGFSPTGGTGGTSSQNYSSIPSANVTGTPSQPVFKNQESPNQAVSAANNSSTRADYSAAASQPARPEPLVFNSQSVPGNFANVTLVTTQVAVVPQTSSVAAVQTATNTVAATNDDLGMSVFDRRIVKIFRNVFGWGYLMLLLLFLLWLWFKLRREWRRRQKRQKR
jgi:hypothetical protein